MASLRDFVFRARLVDYHPGLILQWLLRGQPEMVQQVRPPQFGRGVGDL